VSAHVERSFVRGVRLAVCACALAAAGCAPVTQALPGAKPAPAPAAPPSGSAASIAPAAKPAAAGARSDSLPSPDAERVLASIPEPLAPSEQVPADSTRRRTAVAPEAAQDTLRHQLGEGNPAAPVPAPTPVTSAPAVTFAPVDSAARSAPAPPASSAPAAPAPGASAGAAGAAAATPASGPCWRVQVAAPEAREEAETKLAAAQSLLVVKMAIVHEKGRYKVRTADCMTRDVADAVKRRALESGFDGSFLVDTSAPAAKTSGGSRP
jgi:hypothetical protein